MFVLSRLTRQAPPTGLSVAAGRTTHPASTTCHFNKLENDVSTPAVRNPAVQDPAEAIESDASFQDTATVAYTAQFLCIESTIAIPADSPIYGRKSQLELQNERT